MQADTVSRLLRFGVIAAAVVLFQSMVAGAIDREVVFVDATGDKVVFDLGGKGDDVARGVGVTPSGAVVAGGATAGGLARVAFDGTGAAFTPGAPAYLPVQCDYKASSPIPPPDAAVDTAGSTFVVCSPSRGVLVAKYLAGGSSDSGFSADGIASIDPPGTPTLRYLATAVAVSPTEVVIAGAVGSSLSDATTVLFVLSAAGELQRTITSSLPVIPSAVTIESPGTYVVAGHSGSEPETTKWAVSRYASGAWHDLQSDLSSGEEVARGVAVDGSGRIVAVGRTLRRTTPSAVIARYTVGTDGALSFDSTFGAGGLVKPRVTGDDAFLDVAVSGDSYLVSGRGKARKTGLDFLLAKVTSTGAVASTVLTDFSGGDDSAWAIAVTEESVLLAGSAGQPTGESDFAVARYPLSGGAATEKASASIAGDDRGGGVAVDAGGKRVVVASSRTGNGNEQIVAGRFLPNGTLDPTFGTAGWTVIAPPTGYTTVGAVDVVTDGASTFVAGTATNSAGSDFFVTVLDAAGQQGWTKTIDIGRTRPVRTTRDWLTAIAIDGSTLWVAGHSNYRTAVVSLTTSGTVTATYGADVVAGLSESPNGLVAGGDGVFVAITETEGGGGDGYVARLDPSSGAFTRSDAIDFGGADMVVDLAEHDTNLYVLASTWTSTDGDVAVASVAKSSLTLNSTFGTGGIAVATDPSVYDEATAIEVDGLGIVVTGIRGGLGVWRFDHAGVLGTPPEAVTIGYLWLHPSDLVLRATDGIIVTGTATGDVFLARIDR